MQDMTEAESLAVIQRGRMGHLGLAVGGQAYVLPLLYAFDGRFLYFNSYSGRKTTFLERTQEACFTVTDFVGPEEWLSAQAAGPIRILTDTVERAQAMAALEGVPLPPILGTTTNGWPRHAVDGFLVYRMEVQRLTGRKSHAYNLVR